MKKLLSLLLSIALLLALTGCNPPDTPETSTPSSTSTSADGSGTTGSDHAGEEGLPSGTADSEEAGTTGTTIKPTAGTVTGNKNTTTKKNTTTSKVENNTPNKGENNTPNQGENSAPNQGENSTPGGNNADGQQKPSSSSSSTTTTTTTTTTRAPQPSNDTALVDKAFGLTGSATITATFTGPIVDVEEAYSSNYNNATFTIEVQGSNGTKNLYCYRCKPAAGSQKEVAEGQVVTLTGTIKNYNGTIEFDKATYTLTGQTITTAPPSSDSIDADGIYDSKKDVALYIHLFGKLPKNYVTKSQYENLNRPKDKCVGGNRFYNNEGLLPSGYTYYECDIDTLGTTSRGAKRIVYTKSGIVYYTADHYESFVQLYGER